MIALITGGAGFIGSHLADRLLADGHEVWSIDDLSTGSMHNIDHLEAHPKFHFVLGSVTDPSLMGQLVDRADVIFHMAAAVGVKLIVENPVRTIETNVHGTEVVLQAAVKKSKLVVMASTSEVYGKGVKVPFSEDDDLLLGPTVRSRWGYACSKAIDEYLSLAYSRERNLPIVIARFFNTTGPRQTGQYGMVVPTFVRQGLAGEPITVYGNGDQRRCFGYIGDVVESLMRLVDNPNARGEVYNIGSNHETTIMELAELVQRKTGNRSEIVQVPYDQAYAVGFEDLGRRIPDVKKLHDTIDFHPETRIDEIVDRVMQFMVDSGQS